MQPRRLYWTSIASFTEKREPGHDGYIRSQVRSRLRDLIADESIRVAARDQDHDGSREYTAALYILTEDEMKAFIEHIQRQTLQGLPVVI